MKNNNNKNETKLSDYSNFIATSRYARWLEEEQRREMWDETVDRFHGYAVNSISEQVLEETDRDSLEATLAAATEAIRNLEVMPSMRTLMTAGPALERCNVAAYNCFSGDTTFLTDEGLKTFEESEGLEFKVLAGDGKYRKAFISNYGQQQLYDVYFRPTKKSNIRHKVRVTADHRWLTSNRGEITDLSIGDVVPSKTVQNDSYDPKGWVAGFGFGDGTLNKGKAAVRLCGEKKKFLQNFIDQKARVTYPKSANGDPYVSWSDDSFSDWKKLPTSKSPDFIRGWIKGYLDADASTNKFGTRILSSQDESAILFVEKQAPIAGYVVTGKSISSVLETNYGMRGSPLQKLSLRENSDFYVVDIKPVGKGPVYCAVEPVTKSFVLGNGLLTGNCAYLPIDSLRSFDETMYILLCGTGVGFSVEKQNVDKLPVVNEHFEESQSIITVGDSKAGWARAVRELIALLYSGQIPKWDVSKVRPAGSRLKTFGGRASGPEPLVSLFNFLVEKITAAAGRKLKPIEAHDIVCKIAEVVVVGGVRRSALISLSDLNDYEMAKAKSGNWWEQNPQRALANNSAVYDGTPDTGRFLREWHAIYESKSGERGLFNRRAVIEQAARNGRRDVEGHSFGTNPCSEIILRPFQFCNLSEVVVRASDTESSLRYKIDLAVFLGTLQSTWTDFKYLRKIWKNNCDEERLLGVSLTGIFDNRAVTDGTINLKGLKEYAVERNKVYAKAFGIPQSVAVTCVKPSGTVSQLVDAASGLHPRHSAYYRRTVRGDNKDPMTQFLIESGVEAEPCAMKPKDTTVFSFYIKAPEGAATREDVTAFEHLDMWLKFQDEWCEHKPSVTVNVREKDWPSLGGKVFDNFDVMTGIALLPHSDHTYAQAPYQEITKEEYDAAPKYEIDWDKLREYEIEDTTTGSQELACTGGVCEVVDIGG